MLVFLIISLTITNTVNAKSYIADDTTVISSQYVDMFQNYFGDDISYQYFTYKCDYGTSIRNCYYAIDNSYNYINVTYTSSSSYGYNTKIETGVDQDFSVEGLVFKVHQSYVFIILVVLCFGITCALVSLLLYPLAVKLNS